MAWNDGNDAWNSGGDAGGFEAAATTGGDTWDGGDTGGAAAAGFGGGDFGGGDGGGGGDQACRHCQKVGHFARECPDKPAGECFNCGQVGHNKADCPNPTVERPFDGECKLCGEKGHRALDCKSRRKVDWTGVPEMEPQEAWTKLVDAAREKDIDAFRICLKAYARGLQDDFSLQDVEGALRSDNLPIYLIAKQQEVAPNMTIVDLIGNPDRQFVLTFQLAAKARRAKMAQGWPDTPEENVKRLGSAGTVQDRGIPLCSNCGELGHIRKHCKQEQVEQESKQPSIVCVYCKEVGHRARDCPKERINPFACKNCKQEGHNAKDCPEPKSAENVECRKCNQMGHFSKDCPNVEARTCRNCGSTEHIARECDQPRNPDTVTCRNCEKQGHFSRDCPEPKDWTKVKCSNCGEMGHTIKRCKQPVTEGDTAGEGVPIGGGWDTTDNAAGGAAGGAGGESSWNDGGGGTW